MLFSRAARTWNADIVSQPSILPSCSVSRGCPKSTCIWTLWEMISGESVRVLWFNSGYSSYGSVRRLWRDFAHISTWRWTLVPDRGTVSVNGALYIKYRARVSCQTAGTIISCMRRDGIWKDTSHQHRVRTTTTNNNNNNNTIWGGSVSTGEQPPHHSGELKHALLQAGGPTQSQLSRSMLSRHHISMEHRLRRKHL